MPANDEGDLRRLERRDWTLWCTAIFVMVLLTVAVYSFTYFDRSDGSYAWLDSEQHAARLLLAFVLVFSVFAVRRQLLINRLRRQLSVQSRLAAALQTRAEVFHRLSILDPLTGLYNRRFAMQQIVAEIARTARQQHKLTVIFFDINDLKVINDNYGHGAGDLALRGFADALRRAVRSSDVAVRLGGDEFLVILPECDPGDLPRVLGRLGQPTIDYRGQKIELRYAAGHAEYIRGESAEELLDRADRSAYEDKHSGTSEKQAAAARELDRQTAKLTTMGWLTASVAHDFNNLLTVIKGYTELVLERKEISADLREQMDEIASAAARASSMTGQLLAFSRKQAIEPKILDLSEVVTGTEAMLRRLVGQSVTMTLELSDELYTVRVDSGQICQMLMNLVVNARDAMPRGGSLQIKTLKAEIDADFCAEHRGARQGSYVLLQVSDTGEGMDHAVRSRVFEPFFTTKEPGRGTGLGLSTVYGIVKQNGGYIWVDSEPGHGTCVSVYLSRAVEEVAAAAIPIQQLSTDAEVADDKAKTVLVVESFKSLRRLICEFLRGEGYRVLETGSAEEAVRMAAECLEPIGVLVIDTILPGVSGIELAESLGRQRPTLKILYVSGYVEDSLLFSEWRQNGSQFLGAPFTPREFSDKLRELLEPDHQVSHL